ncbi:MAG: sugar ABC transporter permease [Lachnospiraceae bacterium]|nr:sugar ABC transporter permease [Lachnospiraceae bacterium]MBO7633784.1 sugar ABC transporter permease [Lachnospiraceae bacterium]MBP5653507.1 sugar ABC transporter permease [Lachnospiraceae bacterium]
MKKNKGYFKRVQGKLRLTLLGREALAGLGFALPFLIGFFGLFLPMIVKSVTYSFSNMAVESTGYVLTPAAKNGFEHYIRALTIDPDFNRMLLQAILDMFTKVPLVIIFSFFMANLLNQKFHGRAVARSILFLPVILTSGVVLGLESSDLLLTTLSPAEMTGTDFSTIMNVSGLLLEYTDLPVSAINFLASAVNGIYSIIIASGVQILIFLAGLQSISPSLYEASAMEGATAWESFWKITFPMISPLILVNSIYTIIDSFTSETNAIMKDIKATIFDEVKYGLGSAMAWIYFVCIAIILLIVGGIISRHVFYNDER